MNTIQLKTGIILVILILLTLVSACIIFVGVNITLISGYRIYQDLQEMPAKYIISKLIIGGFLAFILASMSALIYILLKKILKVSIREVSLLQMLKIEWMILFITTIAFTIHNVISVYNMDPSSRLP